MDSEIHKIIIELYKHLLIIKIIKKIFIIINKYIKFFII